MSYRTATTTDVESRVPEQWGGMWFLKDALETEYLGFTVLQLEPGGKGREHDESTSGQEEIYYVVDGEVDVDLEEETVTLGAEQAIRLSPDERRQIINRSDQRVKLVLVGAPR